MIKKIVRVFFLVCFSIELCAQNSQVIPVIPIPEEGVLLDSGWRFKVGDNPNWAETDFDDSGWNSVRPVQDIKELPMLWKDSIVWFRIHLIVDSTQIGDLAMNVTHAGASEFYLNGRLIHRFGVISSQPNEIIAVDPNEKPVSFPVNRSGVQLLAVRYRLEPNTVYSGEWRSNGNFGLSITIGSLENVNAFYNDVVGFFDNHGAFRISAYLILSILYLTFYVSYRRRKTSLYFFIYAFIWAVVWSMHRYLDHLPYVRFHFYVANAIMILQLAGWFFCLKAVYELLSQRKGWMFYIICLLGVISVPVAVIVYPDGWYFYGRGVTTVAILDFVRVSMAAVRQGKKGSVIVAIGAISWLLLWVIFVLASTRSIDISQYVDYWFVFALSHLTLPIAVVVYLGYDFAITNRSLEQKLVEVEKLSEEKNRILSSQNELLERQVDERTAQLTKSLDHLKATQVQLIQSEKMASLGELTAGIAHEIQNPLNFVNNFSDVNSELIDDLKKEIVQGNYDAAQDIADTIRENEDKINHHGKRADGIVKSMLQHSRTTFSQKELTDINALCEEYTRLAYHGFRAKEKSFNAKIETRFDPAIPKINIIRQEIGRVLLNLVNNAFYAVNEKSKRVSSDYAPQVTVATRSQYDKIEIIVADNGDGIPDSIKEKVFQPFFTTKPAGQGTGLGLSLAYDTIAKGHGGVMEVQTREGGGCTFLIKIPTGNFIS